MWRGPEGDVYVEFGGDRLMRAAPHTFPATGREGVVFDFWTALDDGTTTHERIGLSVEAITATALALIEVRRSMIEARIRHIAANIRHLQSLVASERAEVAK
jgi:hypothetical protein